VCPQEIERPFFLRKKKQFSSAEAKKNVTVARARVHVERANQRIRIFEICSVGSAAADRLYFGLLHFRSKENCKKPSQELDRGEGAKGGSVGS
jgi:hypothetical protein